MPTKIILTQMQLENIKTLFDARIGARQISNQLNISRWMVQQGLKLLGQYNIGRTMQRTAFLQTEKVCSRCKQIKSTIEFRKRYNKKTDRHSYESECSICERFLKNETSKKWHKNKRATDPGYKLAKNVSWQIWFHLSKQGSSKNKESSSKYLPWKVSELVSHLEQLFEPWMNWNNYSDYDPNTWNDNDPTTWTWNIDHIIPQSNLPYSSMQDANFKICWALENLRPLSAKQNNHDGVNKLRHQNK